MRIIAISTLRDYWLAHPDAEKPLLAWIEQIAYAIAQGWNPAVEHTEKGTSARVSFWYMWKLPLFGEQSVDAVLAELEACHREFPDHMVRFVAYDNYAQSQGLAFVVYR